MTAPRYKEGQGIALVQLHDEIKRLRRWVLLTALLATFGTFSGAYGFRKADQARDRVKALTLQTRADARDTKYALCTFRRDLEVRVTTSREFLRMHPNGIPGVPARAIRDSLTNQQRTVDALSGIDC
jgi:hypothetical protein